MVYDPKSYNGKAIRCEDETWQRFAAAALSTCPFMGEMGIHRSYNPGQIAKWAADLADALVMELEERDYLDEHQDDKWNDAGDGEPSIDSQESVDLRRTGGAVPPAVLASREAMAEHSKSVCHGCIKTFDPASLTPTSWGLRLCRECLKKESP